MSLRKGTCLHVLIIYCIIECLCIIECFCVTECLQPPTNIFDTLPALSAPSGNELRGELNRYLGADPEMVDDVLSWWDEQCETYPSLLCMALNYLTIPGALFLPLCCCQSKISHPY